MRLSLNRYIFLLLLSCLLHLPPATAQDTLAQTTATLAQAAPSGTQWQQLQHDKAFGYASEKEATEAPLVNNKPNAFLELMRTIASFFAGAAGKAIMWTILFLIIAYVLYRILIGEKSFIFSRSKKTVTEETTAGEEEDLLGIDWEQRLHTAYERGDLRQAVRYSYMWLLQLMQERELIQYRNDKTNHDYYHELTETQYKQSFRRLTRTYEFAWYGHYPVSDAAYQEYMQLFNAIKTRLN